MVSHDYFFNDTATTEIYTLALHDALPILGTSVMLWALPVLYLRLAALAGARWAAGIASAGTVLLRSEEHTSELQSRQYLVCRLLLEKKQLNSLTLTATYFLLEICHFSST